MEPKWQAHERYVQQVLGLDSTITSGNKWFDPGDAVTRGRTSPFPLYADCKCTEKGSFSLKLSDLNDLQHRAAMSGKRLVMPIRFHPSVGPQDYLVIGLHDFAELLQEVQRDSRDHEE